MTERKREETNLMQKYERWAASTIYDDRLLCIQMYLCVCALAATYAWRVLAIFIWICRLILKSWACANNFDSCMRWHWFDLIEQCDYASAFVVLQQFAVCFFFSLVSRWMNFHTYICEFWKRSRNVFDFVSFDTLFWYTYFWSYQCRLVRTQTQTADAQMFIPLICYRYFGLSSTDKTQTNSKKYIYTHTCIEAINKNLRLLITKHTQKHTRTREQYHTHDIHKSEHNPRTMVPIYTQQTLTIIRKKNN